MTVQLHPSRDSPRNVGCAEDVCLISRGGLWASANIAGWPGHLLNKNVAAALEELDSIVERFIVTGHNCRPHSETREVPDERWGTSGFILRAPAHPEDLDLLLLTAAATRKVQRDGIQFAATRYVSPVFADYVGE